MRKAFVVLALGIFAASTTAFAEDAKPANAPPAAPKASSGKKYGTAGCGLGSMVMGAEGSQILAATTNGTGSQTFGITSGTSNCGDTSGGEASTRVYIEANREALAKEIARGRGEAISNLSTLGGCTDPQAVGVSLRKNFKTIFPNASAPTDQVTDSIISTLRSNPVLRCEKLS
jgi:hypothetical protein